MPTAIPTSSTIDEVVLPTGSQRLGMAISEIAEMTAVPASSSGMPAAISAPNTISSRTSETGTEVTSALRKSWLAMPPVARSRLAPPASSTTSPGWRAWAAATALIAGTTAWSSLPGRPATLKVTSAERPLIRPLALSGESMSAAASGSAAQRGDHLPYCQPDLRVGGVRLAGGAALDQDVLAVGLLDDGQGQYPLGLARLPGIVAVEVGCADPLADQHGRGDQQQPADHRGLAVPDRRAATRSTMGAWVLVITPRVHGAAPGDPWCDLPEPQWG